MKKSFVPPGALQQKAKQLRKKSLTHGQALDEAARLYGFSNYQNYKNTLEANRKQSKLPIKILLKNISSENDFLLFKLMLTYKSQILGQGSLLF